MNSAAAHGGSDDGATTFSDVHPDVIQTHILPRLDGRSLAAVSSVSPLLHSLSSNNHLWSHICHSTWPSTNTPRVRHLIDSFPDGPRSFFSLSFPLMHPSLHPHRSSPPQLVISAVDVFYRGKSIYSKVEETETVTEWFQCAPFRIDLLDPKDPIPTPIKKPGPQDTCQHLYEDLMLSWILIDPERPRAVNVSSYRPVAVERHWLTGEVVVRYATVGEEHVMWRVEVTCGGREMRVREVSLQVEDMEGIQLSGRDTLVILDRALEGKRVNLKEGEMRRTYLEFLEKRRERKERKLREEGRLDLLCVTFGVFIFAALLAFIFCRYT